MNAPQLTARQIFDEYLKTLCPSDKVQVRKIAGISMTEYFIAGPLDDVLATIKQVFEAYHPTGYGTMVNHILAETDGLYRARMMRANTSD